MEEKKWNWKIILLLLLVGILIGQSIKWITDERCEYVLMVFGHGFWVETRGYQCKYLDEKCEEYAQEGYACKLYRDNDAGIFETDYSCYCQLRYGEYDNRLDWGLENLNEE